MAQTKFASMYNRNETIAAPTGTEYDKEYTMFIDEKGHKILKCTGETNRYKKIQSYKEECSIENILASCNGDIESLNLQKGLFYDATEIQKMTLAQAQNAILAIKQEFDKLSPTERAEFNNEVENYVALYGTKKWAEKLGRLPKEQPVEEIKEKENTNAE